MPEAYGTATTNRIEELFSLGYTIEEIRLQPSFCNISERTLKRWLENFKWNGTIRDQWTKKRKRCEYESGNLSPALGDFVVDLLEEDPSLYLREIRDEIEWTGSFEVPSISNLYKFLKNRGLSHKKLEERARQAQIHEAMEYLNVLKNLLVTSKQMLAIDEMHANSHKFQRRRGWAYRGDRYERQIKPFVGRDPVSIIAAYNTNGFVQGAITINRGGNDADKFLLYFITCIVPILGNHARGEENSVVILDNARIHHERFVKRRILEFCDDAGAYLIFLPRYQPWYNPIELGFAAVVKQMKATNLIFQNDAALLDAFYAVTACEAKATFRACGYDTYSARARPSREELAAVAMMMMILMMECL